MLISIFPNFKGAAILMKYTKIFQTVGMYLEDIIHHIMTKFCLFTSPFDYMKERLHSVLVHFYHHQSPFKILPFQQREIQVLGSEPWESNRI